MFYLISLISVQDSGIKLPDFDLEGNDEMLRGSCSLGHDTINLIIFEQGPASSIAIACQLDRILQFKRTSPVHTTFFEEDRWMGNPAFSAVFMTSIPTASMGGLARKGCRQASEILSSTHLSQRTQLPPTKPAAKHNPFLKAAASTASTTWRSLSLKGLCNSLLSFRTVLSIPPLRLSIELMSFAST